MVAAIFALNIQHREVEQIKSAFRPQESENRFFRLVDLLESSRLQLGDNPDAVTAEVFGKYFELFGSSSVFGDSDSAAPIDNQLLDQAETTLATLKNEHLQIELHKCQAFIGFASMLFAYLSSFNDAAVIKFYLQTLFKILSHLDRDLILIEIGFNRDYSEIFGWLVESSFFDYIKRITDGQSIGRDRFFKILNHYHMHK